MTGGEHERRDEAPRGVRIVDGDAVTAYVDRLVDYGWRLGPSCHLIADTDEELHAIAARIGMRRAWHQAPPKHSTSHYDLTASRRAAAIRVGAVELDRNAFVAVIRRLRAAREATP